MTKLRFAVGLGVALWFTLLHGPEAATPTWDDEFIGPFASWANAKTAYGAKGDGVADDTLALQAALNDLGTTGHSPVLYLPAGTYRITATLRLAWRIHVSVIGADPATTTLKWAGPAGGVLASIDGMAYSKINRLTFDGAGLAAVLVDQAWDCQHNHFDTGNEYADDVFRNAGIGIRGGNNGCGFAETSVWRSRFSDLTTGVALKNFNALDLWIWYSKFENCGVGVTNDPGAGNYHVYNSVFRNSKTSDLFMKNTGGFNIRNNTSIGSRAFFTTPAVFRYPAYLTLQGNAISTSYATPIAIGNQGPALIVDNRVASLKSAPPITVGFDLPSPDGDAVIVGNRFTSNQPLVVKGRSYAIDNTTSSKLGISEPSLPPTPPRRLRAIFDVPAGAGAATIQQAIDSAWQLGRRAVVHLPAGNYSIDTPLVVPANADIQIIGDGTFSNLQWTGPGTGPVMQIHGPTHVVLRDFGMQAPGAAGLVIDQADQPGSRVYLNQLRMTYGAQSNLLVDGVDYVVVDARDILHAGTAGSSLTVVGGPLAGAGTPQTAKVNLFSGSSCCNSGPSYSLSNGGSLLVRDVWYEGGGAVPYLTATGGGELTVAGARVAQTPSMPAFDFISFHGLASLLVSGVDALVNVQGDASGSSVFGNGLVMGPGVSTYLNDASSPAGQVAFQQTRMMIAGGSSTTLPDSGGVTAPWVRQMLAHTRGEQPEVINRLSDGRTDVRVYRVFGDRATVGVHVKP